MRRAFTMVELLVAIAILTILAAVTMSALNNLEERVKIERTRTIIKRIDQAIAEKWDSYLTRPLSITLPSDIDPGNAAAIRLRAIRDLQRMEMPERATDIDDKIGPNPNNMPTKVDYAYGLTYPTNHPKAGQAIPKTEIKSPPAAYSRYLRIITSLPPAKRAIWAEEYAQAECLYMILSGMRDGETSPLDSFAANEIGDADGDTLKEIHDAWGMPIWFLRWPVGYIKELPPDSISVYNKTDTNQSNTIGDPFDPYKRDATGYGLRPLIVSSGPDRLLDLYLEYNSQNDKNKDVRYADSTSGNPHYPLNIFATPANWPEGMPYDLNGDGTFNWVDNITNQALPTP